MSRPVYGDIDDDFDRLWPIDYSGLWILYDDDDQKNVGDKSKDNAPDGESAKWGFSTLVDPVEDEHLVQIEDHPERDIDERGESWLGLRVTPSNIEPGQAAY